MPDPVPMLQAMGVAAVAAAAIMLVFGWPWRRPHLPRVRGGGVLGIAIGFFVGCWWLGQLPKWPPVEVRDRLLLVLLPAVVLVELVALAPPVLSWLVWPLRLGIVLGALPTLLYQSVYLAGDGSPDSWTPAETWKNLAGWGAALGLVWLLMTVLARRAPGRSLPLTVALASLGGGITMMLSGYATGGPMGFALAGALAGTVAASLALTGPPDTIGLLSVGIVGLFALLVSGRFFSELVLLNAALLFFGPLCCWLTELPPRLRGVGKIALVAVPIGLAVLLAQQKFAETSHQASSSSEDLYNRSSGGIDYGK